jgi:hypothetical protein
MTTSWTIWKSFPAADGLMEVPVGPGVYEVRNSNDGAMVAFGHSASVARDLADLLPDPNPGVVGRLFRRRLVYRSSDLEYRTWPASSKQEARSIAERLRGRRDVFMRRRTAWGTA